MKKFIVFIIIVIVAAWFFFFRNDVSAPESESPTPTPRVETSTSPESSATPSGTPTSTPKATVQVGDTSDWPRVTNTREHFEVAIHPSWWWQREYTPGTDTISTTYFSSQPLGDDPSSDANAQIKISALFVPTSGSLTEVANGWIDASLQNSSVTSLEVGGLSAARLTGTYGNDISNQSLRGTSLDVVFARKGEQTYLLTYAKPSGDETNRQIFEAMVQSFEFLN